MDGALEFYADPEALVETLEAMEGGAPLCYVRLGMERTPRFQVYRSARELVGPGRLEQGKTGEAVYMAVPLDNPLSARPVPQKKGGVLYAWEPTTWQMQIESGGLYREEAVIATRIVAEGYREAAVCRRRIVRHLQARFLDVGGDRVSPEAERLRQSGWRLNDGVGGPLWRDVMTQDERYEILKRLRGTELDRLFFFSEWVRDYEARRDGR